MSGLIPDMSFGAVDLLPNEQAATNINPPPTQQQKDKMLSELVAHYGDQKALHDYAVKASILLPTETLLDWPLRFVPNTQTQMGLLGAAIDDFFEGRDPVRPFVNSEPGSKPQAPLKEAKKATVPRDEAVGGWRAFPCPFGKNSGIPLGKLSEKSLEWYISNFVVTFEYNGKRLKLRWTRLKAELGIEGNPGTE